MNPALAVALEALPCRLAAADGVLDEHVEVKAGLFTEPVQGIVGGGKRLSIGLLAGRYVGASLHMDGSASAVQDFAELPHVGVVGLDDSERAYPAGHQPLSDPGPASIGIDRARRLQHLAHCAAEVVVAGHECLGAHVSCLKESAESSRSPQAEHHRHHPVANLDLFGQRRPASRLALPHRRWVGGDLKEDGGVCFRHLASEGVCPRCRQGGGDVFGERCGFGDYSAGGVVLAESDTIA